LDLEVRRHCCRWYGRSVGVGGGETDPGHGFGYPHGQCFDIYRVVGTPLFVVEQHTELDVEVGHRCVRRFRRRVERYAIIKIGARLLRKLDIEVIDRGIELDRRLTPNISTACRSTH